MVGNKAPRGTDHILGSRDLGLTQSVVQLELNHFLPLMSLTERSPFLPGLFVLFRKVILGKSSNYKREQQIRHLGGFGPAMTLSLSHL